MRTKRAGSRPSSRLAMVVQCPFKSPGEDARISAHDGGPQGEEHRPGNTPDAVVLCRFSRHIALPSRLCLARQTQGTALHKGGSRPFRGDGGAHRRTEDNRGRTARRKLAPAWALSRNRLHSSQIGTRVASLSGAVLAAKLKDFVWRKCRPPALYAYLRCGRCCGTTGLWRAVIA
jgi:hypothetical protein